MENILTLPVDHLNHLFETLHISTPDTVDHATLPWNMTHLNIWHCWSCNTAMELGTSQHLNLLTTQHNALGHDTSLVITLSTITTSPHITLSIRQHQHLRYGTSPHIRQHQHLRYGTSDVIPSITKHKALSYDSLVHMLSTMQQHLLRNGLHKTDCYFIVDHSKQVHELRHISTYHTVNQPIEASETWHFYPYCRPPSTISCDKIVHTIEKQHNPLRHDIPLYCRPP